MRYNFYSSYNFEKDFKYSVKTENGKFPQIYGYWRQAFLCFKGILLWYILYPQENITFKENVAKVNIGVFKYLHVHEVSKYMRRVKKYF